LLTAADEISDVQKYAPRPDNELLSARRAAEILATASALAEESTELRALWALDEKQGREKLNDRLESLESAALTAARNAAYHAVYRNALYLSPAAEEACKAVCGAMHMALLPRVIIERGNGPEWLKNSSVSVSLLRLLAE
jgi:hypothetical protein